MIKRNKVLDKKTSLSTKASIAILLNYFLGYLIVYPILGMFVTLGLGNSDLIISQEVMIGIIIFTTITTLLLALPLFKEEKNIVVEKNIKKILITFVLMYVSMLVLNPLIAWLTQSSDSQNQQLIIDSMRQDPLYVILSAVIMAPIVEEVVFRGVLFRKLRNMNRYVGAIIISSVSFGLMHVLQSILEVNIMDLPFIIVYIVLGLFFVKIYEETGKLSNAILLHFLNNFIGVVAILLTL